MARSATAGARLESANGAVSIRSPDPDSDSIHQTTSDSGRSRRPTDRQTSCSVNGNSAAAAVWGPRWRVRALQPPAAQCQGAVASSQASVKIASASRTRPASAHMLFNNYSDPANGSDNVILSALLQWCNAQWITLRMWQGMMFLKSFDTVGCMPRTSRL